MPQLIRRTYPAADAIATVCDALGDDVAASTGLPRERILTLYNPVVSDEIAQRAREPVAHPWFSASLAQRAEGERRPEGLAPPVVLGVGRIARQKDFDTLIRAFARVRARRLARLVILGEAKKPAKYAERIAELRALAGRLGVADDVDFPGFAQNPFAYMARAAVFALSSRYEGFGNVLIEA
ncbi:MAG: glycosyltransferase, partial [Deltaproteobacteria bacterium]